MEEKEIKKVKLHYREMNQWLKDWEDSEVSDDERPIAIYKTQNRGLGIRRLLHGWEVGDKIWTEDGKELCVVIGIADHDKLEALLEKFKFATYMVNRFEDEASQNEYLGKLENELLQVAA